MSSEQDYTNRGFDARNTTSADHRAVFRAQGLPPGSAGVLECEHHDCTHDDELRFTDCLY